MNLLKKLAKEAGLNEMEYIVEHFTTKEGLHIGVRIVHLDSGLMESSQSGTTVLANLTCAHVKLRTLAELAGVRL